ncbi:ATP-dependent Clp protease adaptor ClpS [Aquicella lusitana]|uniref:ATP-dependent Clp protease adapter protein ClpS n=1 Tax=Aquicella lusitana TaxID=254246 RepID=A0A370GYL4_9COXI|nr:ATP-dependent Clp protease adaptor ClpS [Aquicella lusitana]RDI48748.1 ATP-dependent Clp protease adaptor protein ClpS [Aquicella lusitana]VVC73176.1 ATP-dependent Clp protease adapter protein ClpS [Aquicella lusitana]
MKNEVNKEYTIGLGAEVETTEPALYQVVVHNDDFTPMEFVVNLLEKLFYMDRRRAIEIMLEAHTKGMAAFGRYTKDVAETKVSEVLEHARMHEHPFICSMEAA